ncbi:hypothetical protein A7A08_02936 [Methyloligella halotolerans]|uniref:DUF2735 domain-containing protein n=1 Tax=Methyloligella halotolerans TaxID=1177755 RepID=A0A1E2RW54_9HYPH|nr:DUF2735 domain-containing protein [Methyloligella halotolerans]ODA66289.1 hypothetical protein A7A08_02936 [Methyloligella halotolerans]
MNAFRETAEIIQFPAGGRAGLERRETRTATEQSYAHVNTASGGAWYHEEAIRDANRANNS